MDAASLIARITANVDALQTGMQQADNIVKQGAVTLNETAKTAGMGMGNAMGAGLSDSAVTSVGQAITALSPALGSIVTAASGVAIGLAVATAAVEAFKQAWDLAERGAGASELAGKFVEITGSLSASEQMMQKLRQATKGTITDMDLMVLANRSINMGVTKNADEMARLAAYFKDLGEASGMGASEAVSMGMQALGALQVRGFKALGLSLDDTKIYDAYAEKLGTVASKLDDVQKKAALTQDLLSRAPQGLVDAIGSSADKAEAMHVSFKNFAVDVGQSLEGILKIGNTVTWIVDEIDKSLKGNVASEALLAQARKDIGAELSKGAMGMFPGANPVENAAGETQYLISSGQQAAMTYDKMAIAIEKYRLGTLGANASALDQVKAVEMGTLSLEDLNTTLDIYMGRQKESAYATQLTAAGLEIATDGTLRLAGGLRSLPALVEIAIVMKEVGPGLEAALGKGITNPYLSNNLLIGGNGLMTGGMGGQNATLTAQWNNEDIAIQKKAADLALSEQKRADSEAASAAKSAASEALSAAKQAASEMRSLVESVFQPTEVSYQDIAAAKAGTYADKWDEYGRRMKSIAADQKSVWRDMVPKEILAQGQDAIKAWADQQQKAFYSGQRPGEINKDAFVQSARDMVASQQAREAMIKQGAGWLAEAGIGTVQAADLLGLNTPGAQIGSDAAKSFAQGASGSDIGLSVTAAFGESIKASAETWESYGAVAIAYFITGGKKGITPDIGAAFAAQLWPYLQTIIARETPLP
jgi:hypothetical protein